MYLEKLSQGQGAVVGDDDSVHSLLVKEWAFSEEVLGISKDRTADA